MNDSRRGRVSLLALSFALALALSAGCASAPPVSVEEQHAYDAAVSVLPGNPEAGARRLEAVLST